ncbi:hypothetical protein K227x_36480 [Rubripirellula lacrimiformis]|uniref:Uncharacterized protein n=1 Tax=Rubripirellula lacrimiformis TaxID=1930273 RepID=A0A517NDW0_9BACT|nr:hypothetical protein [Rubripirellula lacrimiformis]QDT05248.1 hypothetical protein K227x_36480 [Rubripirellula lacrimiformis]
MPDRIANAVSYDDSSNLDSQVTDDQIAVRRYMDTRAYRRAAASVENPLTSNQSLYGGLAAISVLMTGLTVAMVVIIQLTEDLMVSIPAYLIAMTYIQTLALPPLVVFSFAVGAALFWYPSVLLRMLFGLVMVLPAFGGFCSAIWLAEMRYDPSMMLEPAICLFTQFMTSATVAILVQFFTPWTLAHYRGRTADPIPPTGLRAFFELTAFFAIGFVILVAVGTADLLAGMMVFGGIGIITTGAVTSLLVGTLQSGNQSKRGWVLAAVLAFGSAAVINAVYAASLFSWDAALQNVALVALASLYGALVIMGTFAICVTILRRFQWQCINRRNQVPAE